MRNTKEVECWYCPQGPRSWKGPRLHLQQARVPGRPVTHGSRKEPQRQEENLLVSSHFLQTSFKSLRGLAPQHPRAFAVEPFPFRQDAASSWEEGCSAPVLNPNPDSCHSREGQLLDRKPLRSHKGRVSCRVAFCTLAAGTGGM